jgi:hypothetical protein
MVVDESETTIRLQSPCYQSATSKANAVARMYFLGNQPAEPLGPGSKEKKSALIAMGRFVGLDLGDVAGKGECGRLIAEKLAVTWDADCVSAGDTVTLKGLNLLIDSAVRLQLKSGERPWRAFVRDIMAVNPAPKWNNIEEMSMQDAISELEVDILEQIKGLMQAGPTPKGVEVTNSANAISVDEMTEGCWRSLLADVQGWLHLPEEIDITSTAAADRSLARLLGLKNPDNTSTEELLTTLLNRLEKANELREEFIDALEDETEGTVTLATASADWDEKWEEVEDSQEVETSGPIIAEASVWPITEFREHANEGDLNLSPSYQRADVWPTGDAQLLIESILRGIPLPSVILLKTNDSKGDHFEIIDGKQRLTSILRFTAAHPRALGNVRAKAKEWGVDEDDLIDCFQSDYANRFKKEWRAHETMRLTTAVERTMYFPFPLRKGSRSTLVGELEQVQGRYYSEIRMLTIPVADETKKVRDLFERQSKYRIPVIIYSEASSRQIHEVFSLYNRQGKRLNAEEIRNAAYHELDFMRALLVTSGDADEPEKVAPFLMESWAQISSTGEALGDPNGIYAMKTAGYKRTKALSWVVAALLVEDGGIGGRSTANQINALLKRIQEDPNDPLRDRHRILKVMEMLDGAIDAHQILPDETWSAPFKTGGRWQELQLVSSFIALAAAYSVRNEKLEDDVEDAIYAIQNASKAWKRPSKTQSRQQWQFIGKVVKEFLEVLGISVEEADNTLRRVFGTSGLVELAYLSHEEER